MTENNVAEKRTEKKKGSNLHFLSHFLLKTGILIGTIVTVLTFVVSFHRMDGNSMFPFMKNGDLGAFYKLASYSLNDVVLYEDSNHELKVGRIVAVGGQTVKFRKDGGYEVNGYEALEEIPYETYGSNNLTLGPDEFFILNDFRSDTTDSRENGPVRKTEVKGKLIALFRCRSF